MLIRCLSCLSSGRERVFLSSGWPTSIIWSSLDLSVSRFDNSLISSRSSGVRFCDSSMIRTDWLLFVYCCIRKSFNSLRSVILSFPLTRSPKSSFIIARSCPELSFVLKIFDNFTSLFIPLIRFCMIVVLPEPTSPVRRIKPIFSFIP